VAAMILRIYLFLFADPRRRGRIWPGLRKPIPTFWDHASRTNGKAVFRHGLANFYRVLSARMIRDENQTSPKTAVAVTERP
jgi:hypothetical protein